MARNRRSTLVGLVMALLLGSLALGMSPASAGDDPRIINGTNAAAGEFPYQVALLDAATPNNFNAQFCGGSLMTHTVVLTAAHCVDTSAPGDVDVLSGTHLLSSGGTRIDVTAITIHPSWNPATYDYDFAVLELASPAPGTPIGLANDQSLYTPGTSTTVTGWGTTIAGTATKPDNLQKASVPINTDAECTTGYPGANLTSMFCAGIFATGGTDACQGDSGGPIVTTGPGGAITQIGVVSWGEGCALPGKPGVYSRIGTVYPWLAQFITCEPGDAGGGLTNMGFETGDFSGWTQGVVVDGVAVTMADAFTAPYEGDYMARLGDTVFSGQPIGRNEICQSFVVDQAVEQFAYNIFTYDYTGFDLFDFELTVVDPATGEVVAQNQQGAWGLGGDTSLKTSGWRGAEFNLASRIGDTLQLTISAGGTLDQLYSFWAYIDSAETGLPPEPVVLAEATSATGSVMTDPFTGQVLIAQPNGQTSDITISSNVTCPTEGEVPTAVTLLLSGTSFPMTETPPGSGTWVATIPAESVANGTLVVQADCPAGTIVTNVGSIQLYDPSGYLTDAETGDPVAGAEVTLYKVPGWTAATEPGTLEPTECESNLSKPAEQPWSQPAPTGLGVKANPTSGEIDPQVNPFVSNPDGYYGWDVAAGCWYVVVEAPGYATLTSPVVGVPPEVTDLDLELTPSACGEGQPGPFPDVPGEHLFCMDIEWLAAGGITGGFEDGTFRPASDITRGSMAAFLYRYAGSPEFTAPATPTFSDVPTSHVFYKEIEWAVNEGITQGFDDGTFRPGATITRGSMAAFFYRSAGEPAFPDPAVPTFSDVAADHIFFTEVEWLVEVEVTTGYEDGTYRPASPVTRGGFAAFLHRYDGLGIMTEPV